MVCIYCGGKTNVVNSRQSKSSFGVWRRRSCILCDASFSTIETLNERQVIAVSNNQSSELVPLSRDEIVISIFNSCRHRQNAINDASALANSVMKTLLSMQTAQLQKSAIKQAISDILSRFDQAAYTHYQAFHQD